MRTIKDPIHKFSFLSKIAKNFSQKFSENNQGIGFIREEENQYVISIQSPGSDLNKVAVDYDNSILRVRDGKKEYAFFIKEKPDLKNKEMLFDATGSLNIYLPKKQEEPVALINNLAMNYL